MRLEDQEVVKWRGWENRRLREAERITIFKIPILLLKRLTVPGPHSRAKTVCNFLFFQSIHFRPNCSFWSQSCTLKMQWDFLLLSSSLFFFSKVKQFSGCQRHKLFERFLCENEKLCKTAYAGLKRGQGGVLTKKKR